MAIHVIHEARHCLQCKKPLCSLQGCPVHTPIPEMIRLFLEGKSAEAGKLLFENNPLSIVCSLVCDHEKQCEGNCIQGRKGMHVQISGIENYSSDAYLDKMAFDRAPEKHQKAAIIGTGPAGITIAMRLAQRGYDVTLFESHDQIGGVLRYGIPAFRLPKSILDRYQAKLLALGIKIRPNTVIGGTLTIDDLFADGYEAVFIGTGVWRPRRLGIPGESLGNVHYAINYLFNPSVYTLGDRVAVIGAGNAAMDVARTAIRQGSRFVTIYARSQHISASQREVDYAKADGVDFQLGMHPERLTDKGPIFIPTTYDETGSIVSQGTPERFPADSTIIAVSQGPKDKIVNTTTGIAVTERGLVETDPTGHTTREGVFASGDVVKGAKTVVEAVKYSKDVADAMDAYLQAQAAKRK